MLAHNDAPPTRESAIQAICISDRENCNPRRRFCHVGSAITKRLAGAHLAQRKNSCLPRENGLYLQPKTGAADHPTRTFKRQMISVERQPGAHHCVPALMMGNNGGSIRGVDQSRLAPIFAKHTTRICEGL